MNGSWQIVPDENEDANPGKLRSADLRRVGGLAVVIAILAASIGPFSFTAATQSCHGVSSPSGLMNVARSGHTATLLRTGKVLVAGGFGGVENLGFSNYYHTETASAELYDPATGIWSPTGSMTSARALHAATLLPSGKVLVAGGSHTVINEFELIEPISSAELYDPATGQWTQTGAMAIVGDVFAAIVLRSGKVFVLAGGTSRNGFRGREAQLYDPASGRWQAVGGLFAPFGSATLLGSGDVLVLAAGRHAFLYEPVSGAWKPAGEMSAIREGHTATLLRSGRVLVTGGMVPFVGPISSAEVYDPVTNTWSLTSSMPMQSLSADATLLPSGDVLIAGGQGGPPGSGNGALASIDLYDPATSTWTAPGAMATPRSYFTATLLRSGAVLYAGGSNADRNVYASTEIYALTCHTR